MIMAMVVVVLMMMKSTKEDNNLDLKEVCLFSVFFFVNCITPFIHCEFMSSSKENDLWRHCFY